MRSLPVLPVLAVLGLGCATTPPPRTAEKAPVAAEVIKLDVKDQTLTGFTAVATIQITNPTDTAYTVTDGEGVLVMDEKEVAKQEVAVNKPLPAKGEVTVEVACTTTYAKDGAEVEALGEKKSLEFALHGDLALQRAGGGEQFVEWAKAGQVRTPRMPVARMYTVQATRSEVQVDLVFLVEVSNPNPFDVKVGALKLQVALNDRKVGDHDAVGGTVPAGGGQQISVPMTVTAKEYGKELISHAKQNRVKFKMTGQMDLGLLKVPVMLSGGVPFSG